MVSPIEKSPKSCCCRCFSSTCKWLGRTIVCIYNNTVLRIWNAIKYVFCPTPKKIELQMIDLPQPKIPSPVPFIQPPSPKTPSPQSKSPSPQESPSKNSPISRSIEIVPSEPPSPPEEMKMPEPQIVKPTPQQVQQAPPGITEKLRNYFTKG